MRYLKETPAQQACYMPMILPILLDTLQTSYLASCFHSQTFHQVSVNTPHRLLIHVFKRQGKVSEIPVYFQFPSEFWMNSVGQIRVLPIFHHPPCAQP